MHSQRFLSFLPALALATLPATSLAADNPGSHQHGHAELQVAIEDEHIELFLLSPAANLVGFEHSPETSAQQQTWANLKAWAEHTPLVNMASGTCSVVNTDVHATWPAQDQHQNDHDHDHSHNSHADVEISQSLTCPGLSIDSDMETPLISRFPALEQLQVQWVSPRGQGSHRLSPEHTGFRFNR